MSSASCIYSGWVMHRRLHAARGTASAIARGGCCSISTSCRTLARRLRWLSHERFNLFAFHDARLRRTSATPLRRQVERHLAAAGIALDGGADPPAVHAARARLRVQSAQRLLLPPPRRRASRAMVYEVHNTFGERHSYVIAAAPGDDAVIRQATAQALLRLAVHGHGHGVRIPRHAAGRYDLRVGISGADAGGPLINATLQARRRELSDAQLLQLLFTHPAGHAEGHRRHSLGSAALWSASACRLRAYPGPPPAVTAVTPRQHSEGLACLSRSIAQLRPSCRRTPPCLAAERSRAPLYRAAQPPDGCWCSLPSA